MHGGASNGPPKGTQNAIIHGIYSKGLFQHEKEAWDSISITSLDDEIRFLKIQLARAAEAQKAIEESPRGKHGEELEENQTLFELDELDYEAGVGPQGPIDKKTVKRRRPDYRAIIDRLTERIRKLVETKKNIERDNNGGAGADGTMAAMLDRLAESRD